MDSDHLAPSFSSVRVSDLPLSCPGVSDLDIERPFLTHIDERKRVEGDISAAELAVESQAEEEFLLEDVLVEFRKAPHPESDLCQRHRPLGPSSHPGKMHDLGLQVESARLPAKLLELRSSCPTLGLLAQRVRFTSYVAVRP